jgi:hypothetical protein
MRLSWAQGVAGVLTCAVVAGLFLLPGRLLGPDQPVGVAVPEPQEARSVQAAPPLKIHHLRLNRAKRTVPTSVATQAPRSTFVARSQAVVHVSPARRMLKAHRTAVIRKLAPTAPLVRSRVLAAIAVKRPPVTPKKKPVSSTAKTIAALGASLRKK